MIAHKTNADIRNERWNAQYRSSHTKSYLFYMLEHHREAYFRRLSFALDDSSDGSNRRFWYRRALESKKDYKRILHVIRDNRETMERLGLPIHTVGI